MGNNRSIFAIDAHDAELFVLVGIRDRVINRVESFLNIHPRHGAFDIILDFVKRVTVCHVLTVPTRWGIINLGNMRRSSIGKTAGFHSAKGGSIPTSAHQLNFETRGVCNG